MKIKILICIFSCLLTLSLARGPPRSSIDIEKFIQDDRKVQMAFSCLLDQKPCHGMQDLKETIPALIATQCKECSRDDKQKFNQINNYLLAKYPEQYKAVLLKYSRY